MCDNVDDIKYTKLLLHEIRKRNSVIIDNVENLICCTNSNISIENVQGNAKKIYETSLSISTWLNCIEWMIYPDSIKNRKTKDIDFLHAISCCKKIYAKEIKQKKINVSITKGIPILLNINPVMEVIPYILFDNAIKYSINNTTITISIYDMQTYWKIDFSSFGPRILEEEKEEIFKYQIRGKNAKKVTNDGEGIGLYLLKELMNNFGKSLSLQTGKNISVINDIEYCEITFELEFDKN